MKAVKWWLELIKGIFEAYEKTTTNHNGYSPFNKPLAKNVSPKK
jgi:hypothetical protein